ncbi:uncharacterized protein LTR77_004674 [Saxophila tyrrhenica]|uniref:Uncharacterized protein n=1 Tax=Saxophila tyrrhenica TaxID=1690608 RepID=A0AAV9PCY9_9PEZI|nr:hypothetical protein LTR77_004674 [Saxophila tyrrhenica]
MATGRRPDIVVGIDIGQTCSGVAYSIGPDWSDPRTLNRWPGAHGTVREDKVATRVGYSKASGDLATWGFLSVFDDEATVVHDFFKLTLDADYEDDRGFSCQDARKWYCDYLRCLHREIEAFFDAAVPNWRALHVEYSFSTPTTWRNPAMIDSMQRLMESAGFACRGQSVRMALTEAEAAAIEASTTKYNMGDIFLICDAGGGTTDVNLLRVKSTDRKIELEPLDQVEGVAVGSTLIDFMMAQHIVQRLESISEHLDGDPYVLAEAMVNGRFQTIKQSFPMPLVDQFWLPVEGLAGAQSFPELGIKGSKMVIDRSVLTEIFDIQIERIFALMDGRLLTLQEEFPAEKVSYIILSGGLGSSPYLFEQIQRRYEMNVGFRSSNTASIRTMKVLQPQLAVVRGLVKERTQQLGVDSSRGQEVFTTRRCRNSYGVLVRHPYNEAEHKGLPTVTNANNKRPYVVDIVEWFIKQGQEVSVSEGVHRQYTSTLADGEQLQPRQARIVMSTLPPNRLPRRLPDGGCQEVAKVNFTLTQNEMRLKNRQVWKLKKKYWLAEFIFAVKLGPADLRFEILGKDGVLTTGQNSLQAEFMDPLEHKSAKTPLRPEFVAVYAPTRQ